MIRHIVATQSRRTHQIIAKEVFEVGDFDLAIEEYRRQLNQFHESVFAGEAHVFMSSNVDGE